VKKNAAYIAPMPCNDVFEAEEKKVEIETNNNNNNNNSNTEEKAGPMKKEEKKKEEVLTDKNMVYMGCAVQNGRVLGIVVKTVMNT
jgi:magnesium-transporting ATPase (P-type)